MNTLLLTTPGEQPRIHVRLVELRDIVPTDALPVGGVEHRRHRVPRHALRRDLPTREPLRAKPQHQLRLDPAYHPNYSFCRVIGHAAEGAYEGGAEAEYSVVLNDENTLLSERCSTAIPMVLRGPNTQSGPESAQGDAPAPFGRVGAGF